MMMICGTLEGVVVCTMKSLILHAVLTACAQPSTIPLIIPPAVFLHPAKRVGGPELKDEITAGVSTVPAFT